MMNPTIALIASAVVVAIGIYTGVSLSRYKSSITEMLGMMVGMTHGMMTGIAVGYFAGAASDMFVSNLIGITIGLIFGIVFGRFGGLMGIMDGGMGGVMGGMMGAMLGVMLQYLYDGWAVPITGVLVGAIYLASMVALMRLVRQNSVTRMEIDLVCNMQVDPKTSLRYKHQDQTYYFCCSACLQSFIKTPEIYLRK